MRLRPYLLTAALLACSACDTAEFRPTRGARDYPAESVAYRTHEVELSCQLIGHVVRSDSLDAIGETVARHGGTHYRIVHDTGDTTLETEWVTVGRTGSASTRRVKHHLFTAEAYRCR